MFLSFLLLSSSQIRGKAYFQTEICMKNTVMNNIESYQLTSMKYPVPTSTKTLSESSSVPDT